MNEHEHRAQLREAPEPEEGTRGIPKVVFAWIVILLIWGVGYYTWQIGKPMQGGDSRTADATASQQSDVSTGLSATPASADSSGSKVAGSASSTAGTKPNGAAIYNAHCSACHQPTGQGIPGAFPPLAGSQWLQGEPHISVAIVHDGLQGPIEVAGNTFQGVMPKFGATLSDAELAAVLSFSRGQWGNTAGEVSPDIVAEHKERFGDRKEWTADELTEVFGKP